MLKSALLDYNPVAQLLNKSLPTSGLISDLAAHFRSLLLSKPDPNLEKILFLLGATALTAKAACLIRKLVRNWGWLPGYIAGQKNVSAEKLKQTYGDCYVLITGFTQGIGRGYAQIFAELGFNLLLVGRNRINVDNKVHELKAIYRNIKIQHFVMDLANLDEQTQIEGFIKMYSDKDIGIVVNNAGSVVSGPYPTLDPKQLVNDINADLHAVFVINRVMIPRLRARERRSAIINLASSTGYHLTARLGVYSSAKLILDHYSQMIAQENKDKIDIISLRPFGVSTKMMAMKKGPWMVTPRAYAKASLGEMLAGKATSFGVLRHQVMHSILFANLNEQQTFKLFDQLWDEANLKKMKK